MTATDRPDDRADELQASIQRGLDQSANGEAVSLGDFTQYVDDRADVIEQAAKVIANHYGHEPDEYLPDARALADAGLLSTPADQDNAAEVAGLQRSKQALIEQVKRLQDQIARARMEPGQDRQKAVHDYADRAERAEAEVAELRRWKAEALPVLSGLQDLGKALGVPLGQRITGETAAEQARALRAERDLLRAQVAAVLDEERAVNDAAGWDDRKALADAFQDGGGHLTSLDGDVYAGLVQVAKYGARWAYRHAREDDTAGGGEDE